MHRRLLKACPSPRAPLGPALPHDLQADSFEIGTDEYVLLSFPVAGEPRDLQGMDCLTRSQRDVASRVLQGQSNAAIAAERGTSPRTIANQLAEIYSKFGVRSRREFRARNCGNGKTT